MADVQKGHTVIVDLEAIYGLAELSRDHGTLVRNAPDDVLDLVRLAEWALDAPHHRGCSRPCDCGRDKATAPFTKGGA